MKNLLDKIERIVIPAIYTSLSFIAIFVAIVLCRGRLDGVIAVLSVGVFLLGVIKDMRPNRFKNCLMFVVIITLLVAVLLIILLRNNIEDTVARAISVICLAVSVLYIILTSVKSEK